MPILYDRALAAFKIETTPGVDANPTDADLLLVDDPQFSADITFIERPMSSLDLSNFKKRPGRKLAKVTFKHEARGNGATAFANTVPMLGRLLRACGMAETIVNTPRRIEYTPATVNQTTATLYVYYDGLLHKLTGCQGDWSFEGTAGGLGHFTFTFTGNYADPTPAAFPTVSPSEQSIDPPIIENAGFSVAGNTGLVISKFSMAMANTVAQRDNVNAAAGFQGLFISARAPTMGFDPEMVLEATHPFWASMSGGTEVAMTALINGGAGNSVQFDAPKVQYTALGYQNRNTIRAYQVSCVLNRNTGNDELKITLK
ncbi:hypothetical protein [Niveispirillum sp. BGYR6]|uniref:phage tail tube protein n=1 Tax=Niveispirillum sp. BGYR6 TaxID=2971249 RepID=UPI0022B97E91|nr:hypothetical protein [Niveispirillum sp. BGYR6]MDG5496971.1 hypothetical protein [Niveispirillum sp. BGYR6]